MRPDCLESCSFSNSLLKNHFMLLQVGSDSYQGAGAPTMFEAMRRIIACLGQPAVGECGFARAIHNSFLGMLILWQDTASFI